MHKSLLNGSLEGWGGGSGRSRDRYPFIDFSDRQIKPPSCPLSAVSAPFLIPSLPPPPARGANYSKGPPRSLSRERHNASARRACTGIAVPGEGATITTYMHTHTHTHTLRMGIGNARRSRRIIRTHPAIPKLCWMHANCREVHTSVHVVRMYGVSVPRRVILTAGFRGGGNLPVVRARVSSHSAKSAKNGRPSAKYSRDFQRVINFLDTCVGVIIIKILRVITSLAEYARAYFSASSSMISRHPVYSCSTCEDDMVGVHECARVSV